MCVGGCVCVCAFVRIKAELQLTFSGKIRSINVRISCNCVIYELPG